MVFNVPPTFADAPLRVAESCTSSPMLTLVADSVVLIVGEKTMVLACIWLSRWPIEEPSSSRIATWYGEPLMNEAELPIPQSA